MAFSRAASACRAAGLKRAGNGSDDVALSLAVGPAERLELAACAGADDEEWQRQCSDGREDAREVETRRVRRRNACGSSQERARRLGR